MPTYTTPRNSLTLALTNGVRYIFRVRTVIDGQEYTSEYSPPSTVSSGANGSGVQVDQDLDIGTGKILYSNVYDTLADLPAAADYHGMFAHVHNYDGLGTGAAFYGHAGNWVRLADSDDVPTQFVSGVNGVAGAITLAAGSGTQISQVGNQLTISSAQTFTTLNGETGDLTLVGGENIQISTQDGLITVSGNDSSTVNGLTGNVAIVAGPNINVATTGQNVVISGEQGGIQWVSPSPSSPSDPGNVGDVAYDNSFLYVYTAQGWRRASLGAWNPDITITTQPQDLLLGVGGSGNFTIAATVSDGSTPNYQWQNSDDNGATWDTITGATGTSYGLSGVSLADNGTLYRAVVSATGAVNVTSDSATLTVGQTSRLLTASNDTLLTETGDALNHDGVGAGGGLTFANVLRLYPMDEGHSSPNWDIGLDAVTQTLGWTRSSTGFDHPQIAPAGKFGNFAQFYDPLVGEGSGDAAQPLYGVRISAAFGVNWTVECWLQRPVSEHNPSFDYFGSNGAPVLEVLGVAMIGVSGNPNDLGLFLHDGSASPVWQSVPGVQSFSDSSWVHVAIVRESNTVRFYANGVQVSSGSTSTANPTTLVLGKYYDDNSVNIAAFGIDDLRITDGVVYPGGTTFTPPTAAHPTS